MMLRDKKLAQQKKWRIPESNLLFLCFCGGGIGTFLAMKYFRHKSKHWKFHISVLISIAVWLWLIPTFYFFMMVNDQRY